MAHDELLTRKAEQLLRAATVVFHDALVSAEVLALADPEARLVDVGKRAGRHSRDQGTIDRLIVEAALANERVVRLKGGDPSVFGRSDEEMRACSAKGIAVAVCPGVTAASAAAAALERSLTLRGSARKLVLVTAHTRAGSPLDLDWERLADPQATLAIYMGKSAASEVSRQLIAAGLPAATPVALVENASLPGEWQFTTRLDLLAARTSLGRGPAIILVGAAMARRQCPARPIDQAAQPQIGGVLP